MSNPQSSEQTLGNLMVKLNNISAKLDSPLISMDSFRISQEEEVYYDVTDVVKLCEAARQTIYNWASRGMLVTNRVTERLLFKSSDMKVFLEQRPRQRLFTSDKSDVEPAMLSEQEPKVLAKEQDALYEAERIYQIAYAYEVNRQNSSYFNVRLVVKKRFRTGSAELRRCCLLYEIRDPAIS